MTVAVPTVVVKEKRVTVGRGFLALIVLGAFFDLAVFSVQGYQIHLLNSQQAQINRNSAKNDCWSAVLDEAIKMGPKIPRSRLIHDANVCANLPPKAKVVVPPVIIP